jgi:hypothetical protein
MHFQRTLPVLAVAHQVTAAAKQELIAAGHARNDWLL